jgi:predicted MFS family arabinose efflux permease
MVAGLFLLAASAAAYEIVPASVTPVLMDRLAIGPTAAGWIVSVMLGTAVLASVPVGIGLDRTDLRRAIAVATLALIVSGLWGWRAAAAGNYPSLIASRIVGALGYTVVWNAAANIVGRSFPAGSRATAIGTFTAGGTAGFALGQLGGPPVADAFGWASIFAVFGGLSAVGFAVFWVASAFVTPADGDPDRPSLDEFAAVLTSRRVWHVCLIGLVAYALFLFFLGWMPTYLAETQGLSLARSGLLVAVFAGVGIVSRTGGGVLSDRLFDARRRPVALLAFVATTPLVVGMVLVDDVVVLFGLLLFAGFFIQLAIGLAYTYVRELVEPNVAATAIATLTSVSLFGGFAAPIVAGKLIEIDGFLAAFSLAGVTAALGVALAWFAPEPGGSR